MLKKNSIVSAIVLAGLATWLFLNGKEERTIKFIPDKIDKIVLFGDGLVSGENSLIEGGYFPHLQQKLSGTQLVTAGKTGDTTESGFQRLSQDVLPLSPNLVVVTLGLEDLRKGQPLQKTLGNLEKIFDALHERKIMVAYGGAALPTTGDNWLMSISQLCQQKGVLYIDGLLDQVWKDASMQNSEKSFPQDAGFEAVAEKIFEAISPWTGQT